MTELTDEWILGNKLPILKDDASFQVQLKDGQTRSVCRKPRLDFTSLWFIDCSHPMQNAYCDEDSIAYWRIKQ